MTLTLKKRLGLGSRLPLTLDDDVLENIPSDKEPPEPPQALLTELGDKLLTESGDSIIV